jgi:hypothetical protein
MRKVKDRYKFDAEIMIYNKNNNNISSIRVGCYDTPEEARTARLQFIENLK